MNIQNIVNKETAIPDEQQFKSSIEIIDDIIKILADNFIPISHAKYILNETLKELYKQPVVVIGKEIKQIYQMRNKGIIKS